MTNALAPILTYRPTQTGSTSGTAVPQLPAMTYRSSTHTHTHTHTHARPILRYAIAIGNGDVLSYEDYNAHMEGGDLSTCMVPPYNRGDAAVYGGSVVGR
eukprot:3715830-Rhodomonas_salina.1